MNGLEAAFLLGVVLVVVMVVPIVQMKMRHAAHDRAAQRHPRVLFGAPLADDLDVAREVRKSYDGLTYRTDDLPWVERGEAA